MEGPGGIEAARAHWQTAAPGQIQLLAAFVYKGGRQAAVPPAIPSGCLFLPLQLWLLESGWCPLPLCNKATEWTVAQGAGVHTAWLSIWPFTEKACRLFFFFQVNSSSFLEAASEPILSKASPGSLLVIVLMKKIQVTGAITREGGDI